MTGMNEAGELGVRIQENFEELGVWPGRCSAWTNSVICLAVDPGTDQAMLRIYTSGRTPSSKQETRSTPTRSKQDQHQPCISKAGNDQGTGSIMH